MVCTKREAATRMSATAYCSGSRVVALPDRTVHYCSDEALEHSRPRVRMALPYPLQSVPCCVFRCTRVHCNWSNWYSLDALLGCVPVCINSMISKIERGSNKSEYRGVWRIFQRYIECTPHSAHTGDSLRERSCAAGGLSQRPLGGSCDQTHRGDARTDLEEASLRRRHGTAALARAHVAGRHGTATD